MKIEDVLAVLPKGDNKVDVVVGLPGRDNAFVLSTSSSELKMWIDAAIDMGEAAEPQTLSDKLIALLLSGSVECIDKSLIPGCFTPSVVTTKYIIKVS